MRWITGHLRLLAMLLLLGVMPTHALAQQRAQPRCEGGRSLRWAEVSRTHTVALADSTPQEPTATKPRRQYFKHTVLGAGIGAGVGIILTRVLWNQMTDYAKGPDTEDYVISAVLFGAVGAVLGSLAP